MRYSGSRKNTAIRLKYKRNPHLIECIAGTRPIDHKDDVIVFGDPITSYILERPLLFNKKLASKLSLNIKFPLGRSETQSIGSATRAWRQLSDQDVEGLLNEIALEEERFHSQHLKSIEEVADVLEKDIEDHIANNPALIARGLKLSDRQLRIKPGRVDLLLKDEQGNLTVVEVKLNKVGRSALQQIRRYVHELKQNESDKTVNGVLVCSGVMPAYENDLRKQNDIRIMVYGWDLVIQKW
ncbi:MAG: DUF91 domain-containing protein [Chloroflexi bacterium]|nr:DUF91 domain-containing protein [Chloroflexota bacterium]